MVSFCLRLGSLPLERASNAVGSAADLVGAALTRFAKVGWSFRLAGGLPPFLRDPALYANTFGGGIIRCEVGGTWSSSLYGLGFMLVVAKTGADVTLIQQNGDAAFVGRLTSSSDMSARSFSGDGTGYRALGGRGGPEGAGLGCTGFGGVS